MVFSVPDHLFSDVVAVLVFGILAIVLFLSAFKAWDFMTKKIDEEAELNKGNVAVAIVMSAYLLSIAYVIGKVVGHVLGS